MPEEKPYFEPSLLKILVVCGHKSLGRAITIMLQAVGYGTIEVVEPIGICERARNLKPDAILFTSDYLTSSVQEKLAMGCSCRKKQDCDNAQLMMLLKNPNQDNVLTSKEMGFNNIIFADASIEKMYQNLERAHQHFYGK